MATLAEIRQQYPQYADMPDTELADRMYQKFYSDMPRAEFDSKLGLTPPEQAPAQPEAPPRSFWERAAEIGPGFVQGARDTVIGGAQLLGRGLNAVAPEGSGFDRWTQERNALMGEFATTSEQNAAARPDSGGFYTAGRIAGNVATQAPIASLIPGAGAATFLPRLASGVAQGAAAAAMQPVDTTQGDYAGQKLQQVGVGGATGGAATALLGGLARIANPNATARTAQLRQGGVTPTPGQMLGGMPQRIEERVGSIPIVGDAVRAGQRRAMEEFNVAALNRTLAPIGKSLPKGMAAGNEAVDTAGKMLGQAYDDIVTKLTSKADQRFLNELANLDGMAQSGMVGERAAQFAKIMDDKVLRRLSANGTLTGESAKAIESELGTLARKFGATPDADQRLLSDALKELQATVRRVVARSNPTEAKTLAKINRGYAEYVRVSDAASRSKDGIFTPAALRGAVRRFDSSVRKSDTARGKALGQSFAQEAEAVLGNKVPDSGTAERLMTGGGLGGMAGGLLGYFEPTAALSIGAGALGYTPAGQRVLARLLGSRPASAPAIAQRLRELAPAIGIGASPLAYEALK